MNLTRCANSLLMRAGEGSPERLLGLIRHLPMPLLNALRSSGLRQTVRLAGRGSRFYREKFAALGIKPDRVMDLEDLKDCYTTAEELRATKPEDLLCGKPQTVIESSGTTGRIARIYLSYDELEYAARQGIILLGLAGITSRDLRLLGEPVHPADHRQQRHLRCGPGPGGSSRGCGIAAGPSVHRDHRRSLLAVPIHRGCHGAWDSSPHEGLHLRSGADDRPASGAD